MSEQQQLPERGSGGDPARGEHVDLRDHGWRGEWKQGERYHGPTGYLIQPVWDALPKMVKLA
ncbi:MAG TPA: hypothetical protein VK942_13180, partial [Actinomycetes bacterium]|nr:hypothetical protein [Actinomycetes bacterium]